MESVRTELATCSYLSAVAGGLSVYSIVRGQQLDILDKLISDFTRRSGRLGNIGVDPFPSGLRLLVPPSDAVAAVRTRWLIKAIEDQTLTSLEEAATLALGIRQMEVTDPQMVMWGLRASVKYGPVAGDMIADRIDTSQIVMLHPHGSWEKWETARLVSECSMAAIAESFKSVGNDFSLLDPEVHDWFLGHRHIEIYMAKDKKKFQSVIKDLQSIGLPFGCAVKDDGSVAVALKPAYADSYHPLVAELTPITQGC